MRYLIFVLLFLTALGSFWGLKRAYKKDQTPSIGQTQPTKPRRIHVETLSTMVQEITEPISALGTLTAYQEVTVSAKAAGTVEEVYRDIADQVVKGQPLARIEDDLLLLERTEAEAGLAEARANLARLENLVRPEEVRSREASLESARARHENAQQEWKRLSRLYEEGIISREKLDSVQTTLKVTRYDYQAAKEQLALLESGARKEEIAMARARLGQAQARLDQVRKRIADTLAISPLAGTISERMVEAGERVVPGTPLFEIIDISRVKLLVEVGEKEIPNIKKGEPASLVVDAYPQAELNGRVTNLYPRGSGLSRTFPVEITIANPAQLLKPGLMARVTLPGRNLGRGVLLPQEALLYPPEGPIVFLVKEDKAQARSVKVTARLGERVMISQGLAEGEEVVLVGQENLSDGSLVKINKRH